ncbi:MAG TPA: FIST N-terminal domain-containing protein [Candidatus Thermoplasmatota archaeon]|nr:FIST N-terminal domain-containing protein [Candidatus Thermoplasmatota archaeon]
MTPPQLRDAQLVLVFGSRERVARRDAFQAIRAAYPAARIVGASTAGEIAGLDVLGDGLVSTAVQFERTRVGVVGVRLDEVAGSREAGEFLAQGLPHEDLMHVLVFADGTSVNGTELVRGLRNELPPHVQVTGGLAGDGERFERTAVMADAPAAPHTVCAVGLYGSRIRVSYGSLGGWDPFGPSRLVTRSEGNRVYEIDGQPALDLYKTVLGEKASGLPATGLLYPLLVRTASNDFVRTLLAVDERERALVFAGDVPQGERATFMRANFERLIQGAEGAALDARPGADVPQLALLISCVGRRMVLQERTADEVAAVAKVLGEKALLAGFYSYGEICPVARDANCTLHNQTMTITVLTEP